MSYTDVFGSATVPSAKAKFAAFSLTANQTFFWPYNSSDTQYQVADIMEFSATAGLSVTFPAANQVSVGESTIVRNIGANTFTVLDASGGTLGTVAAGVAKLFYVNDNTTVAGVWSVLTFGTGTSSADATTLQGLGLLAIGATLNDNHPVVTTSAAYTVTTANRANTLVFTGGSVNCTLPTLATAVDGFSLLVKNGGSGTITFVPQGAETVDQLTLAPGESVYLVAGASSWVTVGYGRSSTFNFTRLNKSLTGATGSISTTEAQNKIINFYGTPGVDCTVTFPAVASVYYVSSTVTTYATIIKTATGNPVTLASGDTTIVICDGVNFSIALSSTYATNISLPSGTAIAPSLKFAASTNTGAYLPAAGQLGLVANGAERLRIDNAGGSTTTYSLNSLDIGRIVGAWVPATLWVGYGSITASYNGSAGIALDPQVTVSYLTLDITKDSNVTTKGYTLATVGTSTYFSYPSALFTTLLMDSAGDLTIGKNLLLNGAGTTSNLGFTTGAGGVVTQTTSRTTGVTLNKSTGQITMFTAAGSATWQSFVVTCNRVTATDTVILSVTGATNTYAVSVSNVGASAFTVSFASVVGTASDTPKINFTVIKGASA